MTQSIAAAMNIDHHSGGECKLLNAVVHYFRLTFNHMKRDLNMTHTGTHTYTQNPSDFMTANGKNSFSLVLLSCSWKNTKKKKLKSNFIFPGKTEKMMKIRKRIFCIFRDQQI